MSKRLNVLVAGGFDPNDPEALSAPVDEIIEFGAALGAEIIEHGHNVLTGCQTELDKVVAEAAAGHPSITDTAEKDEFRVVSYSLQGTERVHNAGTIIQSERQDWDIGGLEATPPELISEADVVILLGGFAGTFQAANWARLTQTPVLPFYRFGGMARQVYKGEMRRFDQVYADSVEKIEYDQVLKSVTNDWPQLALDTVQLAEKLASTRAVLVCMSFGDKPEFQDLLAAIKRVCNKYEYEAERIDESNATKRVVPEILKQVRQAAFVIVDVTEEKPNVYYELGFADAAAKQVVLTARKGTELPFNIADMPAIFWDSFSEFEESLDKVVSEISTFHGG